MRKLAIRDFFLFQIFIILVSSIIPLSRCRLAAFQLKDRTAVESLAKIRHKPLRLSEEVLVLFFTLPLAARPLQLLQLPLQILSFLQMVEKFCFIVLHGQFIVELVVAEVLVGTAVPVVALPRRLVATIVVAAALLAVPN